MKKIWAKDLSIEVLSSGDTSTDPFAMHVEYSLWDIADLEWELITYEDDDIEDAPEEFDSLYLDCRNNFSVFLCQPDFGCIVGSVTFPMYLILKENDTVICSKLVHDESQLLCVLLRLGPWSRR